MLSLREEILKGAPRDKKEIKLPSGNKVLLVEPSVKSRATVAKMIDSHESEADRAIAMQVGCLICCARDPETLEPVFTLDDADALSEAITGKEDWLSDMVSESVKFLLPAAAREEAGEEGEEGKKPE